MKIILYFTIAILVISCKDNSTNTTEPLILPSISYQLEGSSERVSVSYKDFDNQIIKDTVQLPWQESLGTLTLDPGDSFKAALEAKSLSTQEENMTAAIESAFTNDFIKEEKNNTNLIINLTKEFANKIFDGLAVSQPFRYEVKGAGQTVAIQYRDIDRTMIADTLKLPWSKSFGLVLVPGEKFEALLSVKALGNQEGTITARAGDAKETKTGKDIELNLTREYSNNE